MAGKELKVPDIGDFDAVEVIEVLVSAGDTVEAEQALITLESDKATMEVPAEAGGTIAEVKVSEGDQVAQGDVIAVLEEGDSGSGTGDSGEKEEEDEEGTADFADSADEEESKEEDKEEKTTKGTKSTEKETEEDDEDETADLADKEDKKEGKQAAESGGQRAADQLETRNSKLETGAGAGADSRLASVDEQDFSKAHASPSVRKYARELGVDLGRIEGSGRKGRILIEDVQRYVKGAVEASEKRGGEAAGGGLPAQPEVDFSQFGETEEVKLSRIRKLSARAVHKSWLLVPHVTQFDAADITELEAFRQEQKASAEKQGFKLTLLAFLLKAAAVTLEEFPDLNSALSADGERLIRKHYCHIGVAVDTDQGLVVPVIRDVDEKGVFDLAEELGEASARARDGKLKPDDLKGGCFSISSLGGIGGTAFTPIVNAPEVAILGVSKAEQKPVWDGTQFVPRLTLPLSLSYDHRVIDGANAARITGFLADVLGDIRKLLL